MTPAIRASQIPVPARDGRCSRCGCVWWMPDGAPNPRGPFCDVLRCACHDARFSAAIYEGSTPDIDQLTSSGAQE